MNIVDLDLKMGLAEGFGMDLKTPRLRDGGRWFCAGKWDSERCVRKKRKKSSAGDGEELYARGQRSELGTSVLLVFVVVNNDALL